MPMGRYTASSSVSSDLSGAAGGSASTSRVPASASSSRVVGLSTNPGNGDIGTPGAGGPTQALGDKVGESFSTLRHFTSSVVKSFSLSAGLFQAATDAASTTTATTKTSSTIRYTGPGAPLNTTASGAGHSNTTTTGSSSRQTEASRNPSSQVVG